MRRATVTVGRPDARTAAARPACAAWRCAEYRPDHDEVEGREPLAKAAKVSLPELRRQEDLLDAREPAPERRRQRRRHRGGRIGRGEVGGHRLDDGDPRVGGELQRQQSVVVADERDRTLGQLGGEGLVLGAADDVERWLLEASDPATQVAQPAPRRGVLIRLDQASPVRLREALRQPFQGGLVGGSEEHVLAGPEGHDRIDDLGRSLGQGPHVQGVADGHASELELPAQQVAQHRRGQAARQVVVLAGQHDVAGHDHPRARCQCRSKRDQLPLSQLGIRPPDERQLVVGIGGGVAGSREVLGRRGHALALEAPDGRRREPSDRLGIVAKAADPEGRIGRVVGNVAHRRVVHVDPERTQLARRRAGDALGQLLVAGRAKRHRAGELGRRRRPGRSAGRPPGRRQSSNAGAPAGRASWMAAVSVLIWGGSTMLWARKSVTPATPSSWILFAAERGSSLPAKAIMSRARVTT